MKRTLIFFLACVCIVLSLNGCSKKSPSRTDRENAGHLSKPEFDSIEKNKNSETISIESNEITIEDSCSSEQTSEIIEFENNYENFCLSKYNYEKIGIELKGNVIISENFIYEGVNYKITSIASNFSKVCTEVESLVLPDSVIEMSDEVFYDCTNLISITLPSNLESIPTNAFMGCKKLKNIEFPKNLKVINKSAFSSCESLESITIPEGVTDMGGWDFKGCTSLKNITFPSTLKNIPIAVCSNCTNLTDVIILNDNTTISASAFANCPNLKTVKIGNKIYTKPEELNAKYNFVIWTK